MSGLSGPVLVVACGPDVFINYAPFTLKGPRLDSELQGHPVIRHYSQLRTVSFSETPSPPTLLSLTAPLRIKHHTYLKNADFRLKITS